MTEGQHAIDALSFEQRKFPPSPSFVSAANAGDDVLYRAAAADHEGFWAKQALDNVIAKQKAKATGKTKYECSTTAAIVNNCRASQRACR